MPQIGQIVDICCRFVLSGLGQEFHRAAAGIVPLTLLLDRVRSALLPARDLPPPPQKAAASTSQFVQMSVQVPIMPFHNINRQTKKLSTEKTTKSTSRRSAFLAGKKAKKVNPFNESTEGRNPMKTAVKKEGNCVSRPINENKKHHLTEKRDLNTPIDVEVPLLSQDELARAKKKCQNSARRLHKIKRRLLLDIAEEQEKAEAAENINPSASSSPRARRRGRRTRTSSYMPRHQDSDSTMSTFFGESSSSVVTAPDDSGSDD